MRGTYPAVPASFETNDLLSPLLYDSVITPKKYSNKDEAYEEYRS